MTIQIKETVILLKPYYTFDSEAKNCFFLLEAFYLSNKDMVDVVANDLMGF